MKLKTKLLPIITCGLIISSLPLATFTSCSKQEQIKTYSLKYNYNNPKLGNLPTLTYGETPVSLTTEKEIIIDIDTNDFKQEARRSETFDWTFGFIGNEGEGQVYNFDTNSVKVWINDKELQKNQDFDVNDGQALTGNGNYKSVNWNTKIKIQLKIVNSQAQSVNCYPSFVPTQTRPVSAILLNKYNHNINGIVYKSEDSKLDLSTGETQTFSIRMSEWEGEWPESTGIEWNFSFFTSADSSKQLSNLKLSNVNVQLNGAQLALGKDYVISSDNTTITGCGDHKYIANKTDSLIISLKISSSQANVLCVPALFEHKHSYELNGYKTKEVPWGAHSLTGLTFDVGDQSAITLFPNYEYKFTINMSKWTGDFPEDGMNWGFIFVNGKDGNVLNIDSNSVKVTIADVDVDIDIEQRTAAQGGGDQIKGKTPVQKTDTLVITAKFVNTNSVKCWPVLFNTAA